MTTIAEDWHALSVKTDLWNADEGARLNHATARRVSLMAAVFALTLASIGWQSIASGEVHSWANRESFLGEGGQGLGESVQVALDNQDASHLAAADCFAKLFETNRQSALNRGQANLPILTRLRHTSDGNEIDVEFEINQQGDEPSINGAYFCDSQAAVLPEQEPNELTSQIEFVHVLCPQDTAYVSFQPQDSTPEDLVRYDLGPYLACDGMP